MENPMEDGGWEDNIKMSVMGAMKEDGERLKPVQSLVPAMGGIIAEISRFCCRSVLI
jgi:hypothetical protein